MNKLWTSVSPKITNTSYRDDVKQEGMIDQHIDVVKLTANAYVTFEIKQSVVLY